MQNEFLMYLLTSAALQMGFWLVYKCMLNTYTSLRFERVYLLVILILSLTLPMIEIPVSKTFESPFNFTMEEVLIGVNSVTNTLEEGTFLWNLWFSVYVVGAIVSTLILIGKITQFVKVKRSLTKISHEKNYVLYHTGGQIPTSSFLKMIFWDETNDLSLSEVKVMLAHEEYHVKALHALDRIYTECLQIICWFSPAIYLIKSDLILIHEAQADQAALQKGSKATLAKVLMQQAIQSPLPLSQSFSQTFLSRRVKIIQRNFTSKYIIMRTFFALFLAGMMGISVAFSQDGNEDLASTLTTSLMPTFKEYIELDKPPLPLNLNEIRMAIGYPKEAREKDIQGDLAVRILVNPEGEYVKHVFVQRASSVLEAAVVKEIPNLKFKPAQKNGQAIASWVTLPFKFRMDKNRNPINPDDDDC